MDIGADPVHCELVYLDFEDFCATSKAENTSAASKNVNSEHVKHQGLLTEERVCFLQRQFAHREQYLKSLVTCEDWDDVTEQYLKTEWLKTWLCVDSIAVPEENLVSGYIALSYVWSKLPRISDAEARLFRLRRILKDISPTCAELLEKIVPEESNDVILGNDSRTIILDGTPFKVGCNLENALRALRGTPEVQSGLLVWADALCINQNDIPERNIEGDTDGLHLPKRN
jgi:hypothetical protein